MGAFSLAGVGLALDVQADGSHRDHAAEAEALGYSAVWLPGGQIDNLGRLTELAQATTTIPVIPAVLSVGSYAAYEVAGLFADLQRSNPCRFVPAFGGPQTPRPLQALREYLDRLDASQPSVPADRRLLAALGPRKLELARDRAAGAVPLLVTPEYTEHARAVLGSDAILAIDQMVVLDTDPEAARAAARGPLRFLSTVGGYTANFARMGFTDVDIATLSSRLTDQLVAWGDADAVATRIHEHLRAGADHVFLTTIHDGNQPGPIETARRLADTLFR